MSRMRERTIFHIDANSAYLSWTAADRLNRGATLDLRTVPAIIGGDPQHRQGIVLAKSIAAKKCGIVTGESLFEARQKCRDLWVLPPNYDLYMDCSQAMYEILKEYSPAVQRYSIDECFLDYTHSQASFGEPEAAARQLANRISRELGFTVNVGIGPNKLLAKMAGELRKPDAVETIWQGEIQEKLWPLPVRELFMVGKAAERKLQKINIATIGQLAAADPALLRRLMKFQGELIWRYAHGIDSEPVVQKETVEQKGVGNSTTMKYDMKDPAELYRILLALCERTGMRLRRLGKAATGVSVTVKAGDFACYSHQAELGCATDATTTIYREARRLLDACWRREPVRHLGVALFGLQLEGQRQLSLFQEDPEKEKRADTVVDRIRQRYGDKAIVRGSFANGEFAPLLGGVNEGDYITMGGYGI